MQKYAPTAAIVRRRVRRVAIDATAAAREVLNRRVSRDRILTVGQKRPTLLHMHSRIRCAYFFFTTFPDTGRGFRRLRG